jgi:hypothetical protein
MCLKAGHRKRAGRGEVAAGWVPARQNLCTGREIEGP